MQIRVSKESQVPIREQIVAHLEFLIATRELGPGDALPSVRALAIRLKVHHNTISQAYQELAAKDLLVRRRGSRVLVRSPEEPRETPPAPDLDDLINETMRTARKHGYSLQQLRQRLRERMLAEPPDHILTLSTDSGMRVLLQMELQEALNRRVDSCAPEDLVANPGLAIGALVMSPPGPMPEVVSALPKERPPIPITYRPADEHVELVQSLPHPSCVALVSISEYFLQVARGILAPVVEPRHSMREYLLTANNRAGTDAADLVFCDQIAFRVIRAQSKRARVVPHRLISRECLEHASSVIASAHLEDVAFQNPSGC